MCSCNGSNPDGSVAPCRKNKINKEDCLKPIISVSCTSIRAATTFASISAGKALMDSESPFGNIQFQDSGYFSIVWAVLAESVPDSWYCHVPEQAIILAMMVISQMAANFMISHDRKLKAIDILKKYISLSIADAILE